HTPVSPAGKGKNLSGDSIASSTASDQPAMWQLMNQVMNGFNDTVLQDWSRNGSSTGRHVDFGDGPLPAFSHVRTIGMSNSTVDEVICQSTRLAKKAYNIGKLNGRREKEVIDRRKEIEMLRRLRHRHVIELVGSFTHSSPVQLELLFWPVAPCSLSLFIEALD